MPLTVAPDLQALVDRLDGETDRAHHQGKAHHRAGERRACPAKGEDDENQSWHAARRDDRQRAALDEARQYRRKDLFHVTYRRPQ